LGQWSQQAGGGSFGGQVRVGSARRRRELRRTTSHFATVRGSASRHAVGCHGLVPGLQMPPDPVSLTLSRHDDGAPATSRMLSAQWRSLRSQRPIRRHAGGVPRQRWSRIGGFMSQRSKHPAWNQALAPYAQPRLGRSLLDVATSVVPYLALSVLMYLLLGV